MKKRLLTAATLAVAVLPLTAQAEDLLTGDVRLACEATLCLSSGSRPSECNPSLRRYFDITRKKLSDTLSARRDFLDLCPASKEEGMPQLISAIVNGAGRCDAAELNRINRQTYNEQVCTRNPFQNAREGATCMMVQKNYVKNSKPAYCSTYFDHAWTGVGAKVQYQGSEKQGGRWVDVR